MSVRVKLIIIIVFVALVPLVVSAVTALNLHSGAYNDQIRAMHDTTARFQADKVQTWLDSIGDRVESVATQLAWTTLTREERAGALTLVYQQVDSIAVTQLLDRQGRDIGEAILVTPERAGSASHPAISLATVDRLIAHRAPRDGAGSRAIGRVVRPQGGEPPLVPITIALSDRDEPSTLLVGLSLGALCRELITARSRGLEFVLVDGEARIICAANEASEASAAKIAQLSPSSSEDTGLARYRDARGRDMLAAAARMPSGWTVIAQQPEALATRSGRAMRQQAILWLGVSLLIALLAGWNLARGVSRPLRALTHGAEKLAQGDTRYQVDVTGRDEFGQLATAFNHMTAEIHKRDHEIREWNAVLEQRVDARTRELADAQQQLLQSHTIAAMSSLASGMAHEINNPLTAVLGMTQVMKRRVDKAGSDDSAARMLHRMEVEATRIRDIVSALQKLVERPDIQASGPVDGNALIEDTVAIMGAQAREAQVSLACELGPDVPSVWGCEPHLREVIVHLLSNAIAATDPGGRVDVTTREVGGKLVKWTIVDTGRGIAPEHLDRVFEPFFTTKDTWQGKGLGLTIAYRRLEEHQGTLDITSEVGQGTKVTVTLPGNRGGAHLL